MKTTTAVAISGGVDSLMAAHLLKKQGHRVVGIHFRTGFEKSTLAIGAVADQVGIDYQQLDFRNVFSTEVVDYFVRTYADGKTPNPCLVCNPVIKFGHLLEAARNLGADRLATGHYARLRHDADGTAHLLRGVDAKKDQSYFLAFLDQKRLSRACFPLGEYRKSEVKAMAAAEGYRPAVRSESQDACFIQGRSYSDFIEQHAVAVPDSGDIVDRHGRVLGRHHGLHRYTIGQRRGLNCPAAEPYYVLQLDTRSNRLVVGFKKETFSRQCRVDQVNWIRPPPPKPVRVHTRLRYRHRGAASTLQRAHSGQWIVRFDQPQSAVTPGQGAVFYRQAEVIGGGIIQ
jgi:tRNA-specific 2-thiouridylase